MTKVLAPYPFPRLIYHITLSHLPDIPIARISEASFIPLPVIRRCIARAVRATS